jgi:predicted dehydrogenase
MREQPIRVGVVGVRYGSIVHIPGFQSEGVEVVAVCASHRERAEEVARQFEVPHAFTDYDEMLRLDELDAVSIVTPVTLHYAMTMKALAAGKHVICEKPFGIDQAQAREMWEAAERSGRTAMIGHEFRFASGRMRVKELIDEGYIGNLRLALVRIVLGPFGRRGQQTEETPAYVPERDSLALGAGFLYGLGSHYIDGLRHWFGEVASVSGELINFAPRRRQGQDLVQADADDTFLVNLKFVNGGYAQLVGTRSAQFGSGAGIEIYGDSGTLVTPQEGMNPPPHGTILGARVGEAQLQPLPIPERLEPLADDRDDRLMPFRLMVREFVRGIHEGTAPAPSFHDGLRVQQILDAIRESSATGLRVQIPQA